MVKPGLLVIREIDQSLWIIIEQTGPPLAQMLIMNRKEQIRNRTMKMYWESSCRVSPPLETVMVIKCKKQNMNRRATSPPHAQILIND